MCKFNKKEVKYYEENFLRLMNIVDAKQDNLLNGEYIVNTHYGILRVSKDDLEDNIGILAIHTRFDDVEISRKFHESNTGKWNCYSKNIVRGLKQLYTMLYQVFDGEIEDLDLKELKTNKFTNATVFYNCNGEQRSIFCTNRNLTNTLSKLNKYSWITNIEVVKYDFN